MFYIRKNSIQYLETSRGMAFTANLHEKGTDKMVGMVEQAGRGGCTTFNATDLRTHQLVQKLSEVTGEQVEYIMDTYMDLAEGEEPLFPKLAAKLSSY